MRITFSQGFDDGLFREDGRTLADVDEDDAVDQDERGDRQERNEPDRGPRSGPAAATA